jgi:CRISPR-associated protein Csh2
MSNEISKNSEILFIYEAKMTNPNGDPDDENRPRMDPKTKRNIVTDVRLKRYFRDYIISKNGENSVWVTTVDGKHVDATDRIDKIPGGEPENVLESCIDARLFGATIPLKSKKGESRGSSYSYTGPVQFTWGHSLHKVDMVDSRSITSIFSGRGSEYGTIGKDYRVYYSMIAFYGVVSKERAKKTNATEDDLKQLDEGLWNALVTQTVTRSKIGQRPLLYLRVEYENPEDMLGDLRRFIKVKENKEYVREFSDLDIDFDELVKKIEEKKAHVVVAKCAEELTKVCNELK